MSVVAATTPTRIERALDTTLFVVIGALLLIAGGLSTVYLSAFLQFVLQFLIFAVFTFGMVLPILERRKKQDIALNRLISWSFRGVLVLIGGTVLMALNTVIARIVFAYTVTTSIIGYLIIVLCFLAWVRYYFGFLHRDKS